MAGAVGRRRGPRGVVAAIVPIAVVIGSWFLVPVDAGSTAGSPQLAHLTVARWNGRWDVQACVADVGSPLPTDYQIGILLNGSVVPIPRPTLLRDLPPVDPDVPRPRDSCPTPILTHFDFELDESVVHSLGVEAPPVGTWTSFQLDVWFQTGGVRSSASRTVDYSVGPPTGRIDGLTTTPAGMRITGEIVDPEDSNVQAATFVLDGTMYTGPTSGTPNYDTDDLDDRWVDRELGSHHRIDQVVPFARRVCVLARDTSADALVEIGCVAGLDPTPTGRIESVTQDGADLVVRGWVFHPNRALDDDPTSVSLNWIELNGVSVPITPTIARPDLAATFPGHNTRAGFDARIFGGIGGLEQVCLRTSPSSTNWANRRPAGSDPLTLDCAAPVRMFNPFPTPALGAIEERRGATGAIVLGGWAADPNGGRPNVLIAIDGRPAALVRPDRSRPDVLDAVGGDPLSGFSVTLEASRGSHHVCVAWSDAQTGAWQSGSCGDVVVK